MLKNETGFMLLKILNLIVGDLIYLLSSIFPKDKNLWVFGSWYGDLYSDNSKYFFQYMKSFQEEIESVWITKNPKVYDELKKQQIPVYMKNSFQGLIHCLRAKVFILSTDKDDINQYLITPKNFTVQLWHGVGNKKIMYDNVENPYVNPNFMKKIEYAIFPFLKPDFNLVISTSFECQRQFISAFRLNRENVPITGYPRNDIFFCKSESQNHSPKILYAPTFRTSVQDFKKVFPSQEALTKLDIFLQKEKATFIIKLHYRDKNKLKNQSFKFQNIFFDDNSKDLQEILLETDILITDYSSIYFDYLLLNRPIIFTPFDYEDYLKKERDLHFPYDEISPGPKAKNWDEVMKYIHDFIKDPSLYETERTKIRDLFFNYQDGKSSERIYQEIIEHL